MKIPLLLVCVTTLALSACADVFYIATLVSYIKISGMAQIHFGLAFWFMMVLGILLIRTSQGVPEHWIFYQIQRLTGHEA